MSNATPRTTPTTRAVYQRLDHFWTESTPVAVEGHVEQTGDAITVELTAACRAELAALAFTDAELVGVEEALAEAAYQAACEDVRLVGVAQATGDQAFFDKRNAGGGRAA